MSHCKEWGAPHEHAHGTTTGWRYHGCRCAECETAHYAYHRASDRKRSRTTTRRAYQRNHHRAKRAEGHPAYQNHGDPMYHAKSGWAAQKRYTTANRELRNSIARARTDRLRESVSAKPKKWWSPQDDAVVLRDDINLIEMTYLLGRTPGAIAQRRLRLSRGAQPRYYRSDAECIRGHSRVEHGYRNKRQWVCRECQRMARARHQSKVKEQAA